MSPRLVITRAASGGDGRILTGPGVAPAVWSPWPAMELVCLRSKQSSLQSPARPHVVWIRFSSLVALCQSGFSAVRGVLVSLISVRAECCLGGFGVCEDRFRWPRECCGLQVGLSAAGRRCRPGNIGEHDVRSKT